MGLFCRCLSRAGKTIRMRETRQSGMNDNQTERYRGWRDFISLQVLMGAPTRKQLGRRLFRPSTGSCAYSPEIPAPTMQLNPTTAMLQCSFQLVCKGRQHRDTSLDATDINAEQWINSPPFGPIATRLLLLRKQKIGFRVIPSPTLLCKSS